MKTVLVFASLLALSLAGAVPQQYNVKTKTVDADFVARQKKVLSFFDKTHYENPSSEYYKIGKDYDVQANINSYTNKEAVENFLTLYNRFLPKHRTFSVFNDEMQEEVIALFNLFYYAKDFETFYKTAAFAKVHMNQSQFYYAFYTAVFYREDTNGIVLPALYEVFPEYYTNFDITFKSYFIKMMGYTDKQIEAFGIFKENNDFIFYSNYSYYSYPNEEQKLAYFTEDVGLNNYYALSHLSIPFWMNGKELGIMKERRGEFYFYFYQQFLARYYLERLSNGLGDIPKFSWYKPIKTGYAPNLAYGAGGTFQQRNNYYNLYNEQNYEDLQFLDTYEKTFLQYLQRGQFKAYNQEVDLYNSKATNFVGNYWQSNPDLYEHTTPKNYEHVRSYESVARRVLSAAPESLDKYNFVSYALGMFSTSARDPMFYQLYARIMNYFLKYKEYVKPYTQDNLHYVGVKINDVKVDKLTTFYEFFDYDISNGLGYNMKELTEQSPIYKVRQPRLNHKPFSVNIDVKSDVDSQAVFKIFLGPKYDSNGYPINLEDNWMNFVELDWFVHKLTPGQNKIERSSEDFFFYKEDSIPTTELLKMIDQGKVPIDMSESYESFPNRLMLPKGTYGGFPYQLFVFVYPYQDPGKEYEPFKNIIIDAKPLGYPLDRPPVTEGYYFTQPNMFFEDVSIYFEGPYFPYTMNNPFYVPHKNEVPKH